MSGFDTWEAAHAAALTLAREVGRDVGLERSRPFGRDRWSIFLLPEPAKRFGHELRCEVVQPTD